MRYNNEVFVKYRIDKDSIVFWTSDINENISAAKVLNEFLYDFSKGDGANWLSDFDFSNLYNANPNSITEYGATTVKEFFAEAGSMYINNPEELEQKNIDVYNYFELLPKE